MPTMRKLTPDEVQTIENKGRGLRKLAEEQYDRFLAEYDVGDYGEARLDPEEKRLTVRNRFRAAAGRRGLSLQFIRTIGNVIRFKVLAGNGSRAGQPKAQGPVASDAPPAAKRGPGRPKKVSA